ncbi:MAG: alpha-2-macroglobulin [Burkholderiaceae bacterium]|jgi:uncharacterized protein YfaS (alpha-2-macroglobulin family)|nr:alpha-2-macroglobulin [Burkholderiaceae bacterium]
MSRHRIPIIWASLLALFAFLGSSRALALTLTGVTPQGEVAQVRQVVARFDQSAVNFGDPRASAPLTVTCDNAQAGKGTGRWLNDKQWVFDFADDLPAGVRCTVTPVRGFKSPAGAALKAAARYAFNTGGPAVSNIYPDPDSYDGADAIDEQQVFLLELTSPATPASVSANVWCNAEDLGERIPVQIVEGATRAALIKNAYWARRAKKEPQRFFALQCKRTLSSDAGVQLVYGRGVATPSGVANSVEQRYDFKVRKPFAIDFSCERENAQSGCLPIRPMQLRFNAPVTRALAAQITLTGGGKTLAPTFDADADKAPDAQFDGIQFTPPFDEQTDYTIELPKDFKDISGRTLGVPESFPLHTRTGAAPPLAKFAAAPFGIVERLAEPDGVATMPVTVRRVEPALAVQDYTPGQVADLSARGDADIIAWMHTLRRYDETDVPRDVAAQDVHDPLPPAIHHEKGRNSDAVESRTVSLLAGQSGVHMLNLPPQEKGDTRPFEVIGIPLTPGYHVLEIASPQLGRALLDEGYGAQRTMYVRTGVLVTNLAVHFKLGRENALAWVTTLDKGQPVTGARVQVSDCRGKVLASGSTDAHGIVMFDGLSPQPPDCNTNRDAALSDDANTGYFVSARATDAKGVQDLAFVWSDWKRGIEPWRFSQPTSDDPSPDRVVHTIFDRTLFHAGETVSMKHLIRNLTASGNGFSVPSRDQAPDTLLITHVGSGQQFRQPLTWHKTGTGGLSAENTFAIPAAAKLGEYDVTLLTTGSPTTATVALGADGSASLKQVDVGTERSESSGAFRVEDFRLPVFAGRVDPEGKEPLVAVTKVPATVQINYVAGGGAARLSVKVSALVRYADSVNFPDYDDFSFDQPRRNNKSDISDDDESDESDDAPPEGTHVVADKLPLMLDTSGLGKVTIGPIPADTAPRDLVMEASYADPNGEVQTLRSTQTIWPAAVIAGLKTGDWIVTGQKVHLQALALDLNGKPQAGVPLEVRAVAHITTTSRKRMVGGFYAYDNKNETKNMGSVCSGQSDSRGLLPCDVTLNTPGNIELIAVARDAQGRQSQAANTVYVNTLDELWFGGENHDRIDVLPEKKNYAPGETARFQVRMPFRFATALVAVEREGIMETHVVKLGGKDPNISLQVKPEWAPNVYVSVLALRGRIYETPWYSFFTWGWRAPRAWWRAYWYEGREYTAPTAMVDLSKPAFRLGVAAIRVGAQAHTIAVKVSTDKPSYQVRGKAQVTITGTLPDGKPAAGAEVAVAAVDQALLELMPNDSWKLLDAMLQQRSWGVATATAQMEIIGRRHYGRKAVPAGGGGGKSPTRELLDTLLLWNPRVILDAQGRATLTVPLNDALTTFRIVAVADEGTGLFGTGQTTINTTQDLQIISGLPPLVREGDHFRAQITLRNTTKAAMKVRVTPYAPPLALAPQTVEIPAGDAREIAWDAAVPAQTGPMRLNALHWEIEAHDTATGNSGARDALKFSQRVVPAVPLTVQQANLVQLDTPFTLNAAPPAGALPGQGGLRLALQPRLAEGLPAIRDWFDRYPYDCLEQKVSKSIGLRDLTMWHSTLAQMPTYLDKDGLANYFPPSDGEAERGSDILTSYILASANEAAQLDPAYALPDDLLEPMARGLTAFVQGRIERKFWSPRPDLDVRKLAAIEALSRYGKADTRMLESIAIAPSQWPTSAVIDWLQILQRLKDAPQRAQRITEADNILKARLSYQGTKLIFSTDKDDAWWWLMTNGDVNAARLLIAVMNDPAWKDDAGKLVGGFINRQQNGAWHTTTANLWGGLALQEFSRKFESAPVSGVTHAEFGNDKGQVDWSRVQPIKATDAEGVAHQGTFSGAPSAPENLRNNTLFLPWPGNGARETLRVTHEGSGKPWLTLQSVAALPLKAPFAAGYAIKKTIAPVEQAVLGKYTRGDVLRITVEINASADMTWAVVTDPIPAGATILGSGLGRDSEIATQGEKSTGDWFYGFDERSFEAFRRYYEYLPKGIVKLQYTVRLNNAGNFNLPPTRVEAMYAPEMFGETPNARMTVEQASAQP